LEESREAISTRASDVAAPPASIVAWRRCAKDLLKMAGDSAIVVSYPKSGRTWHRVILSRYIATLNGLETVRSIDTRKLTRKFGLPRISYSHNGANFLYPHGPRHPLNGHAGFWRGRRILLLVREPKDVLVSCFFHAKHRSRSFDGNLSEFIRHPHTGIEKLLVAHHRWFAKQGKALAFMVQRYEEMLSDTGTAATKALEFLGFEIDQRLLSEAIEFARFDNLRVLEEEGYFQSGALGRTAAMQQEAKKVRAGRVNGYREHMTAADIDYIQSMMAKIGHPWF
jgi:sulfotransferase family protein